MEDGKGKMEDGKGKRESGLICRRVYIIFEFGTRDNLTESISASCDLLPGLADFRRKKHENLCSFTLVAYSPRQDQAGAVGQARVKASMLPLSRFP
ncbi:hypothetical protein [Pedobacter terrae]|uniref:hypothetical protein n=1 Tax=Pedobacter terrae TaxID=405671 RepID=UPI002FFAD222